MREVEAVGKMLVDAAGMVLRMAYAILKDLIFTSDFYTGVKKS